MQQYTYVSCFARDVPHDVTLRTAPPSSAAPVSSFGRFCVRLYLFSTLFPSQLPTRQDDTAFCCQYLTASRCAFFSTEGGTLSCTSTQKTGIASSETVARAARSKHDCCLLHTTHYKQQQLFNCCYGRKRWEQGPKKRAHQRARGGRKASRAITPRSPAKTSR